MWKDPIVEEIRRIRDEYAAKFNNDLAAICCDLREKEERSGRKIVSFPPKRIDESSRVAEERPDWETKE